MLEEEKGGREPENHHQMKPDLITRAKEKLYEWRSKKQMAEEEEGEPAEFFEDIKLEI